MVMGSVGHLRVITDDATSSSTPDLTMIYAACADISARVEPDGTEIFIDLAAPGCKGLWRQLLLQLSEKGISLALGLATSKLVAKLASGTAVSRAKTYHAIRPGQEAAFLRPLPIEQLWVAPEELRERLIQLGFRRIGQLHDIPVTSLEQRFGRYGWQLRQWSLGIDSSVVAALYPPKVIEVHRSFSDNPLMVGSGLSEAVAWAAAQVTSRLLEVPGACQVLQLQLCGASERCYAQSHRTTHTPLSQADPLRRAALRLLEKAAPNEPIAEVRLLASDLAPVPITQPSLFATTAAHNQAKLAVAIETIRAKFGAASVQKGSEIAPPRRDRFLALLEQLWLG
jgi:DNA polymerase-4